MRINSKRQFFELWEAGVLGNRTALYRTKEQVREAILYGRIQQVGFREIGRTGGGAWTRVTRSEFSANGQRPFVLVNKWFIGRVNEIFDEWTVLGRTFLMDNGVPNDKTTMQGEVVRTYRGLESFLCVRDVLLRNQAMWNASSSLTYSLGPGLPPMRQTIAAGLHRHRGEVETNVLLDRYMDPSSRDDLRDIMDLYPDAAVEFTCFSVNVGNLRARNTIFWEVRNY